jgi:hypothetical protein
VSRSVEEIVADLDALAASDFDEWDPAANGRERLYQLCDEVADIDSGIWCAPAMFAVMERLDSADLGSPGPLVHTLEAWPAQYELHLVESVRRRPAPLSVWMVNRILNQHPVDCETWLGLLRDAAEHPAASETTKQDARDFLAFQTGG